MGRVSACMGRVSACAGVGFERVRALIVRKHTRTLTLTTLT